MGWYEDSCACLEVAEASMNEILEKELASLENDDVVPFLKVSIKNYLENCRSPLDYVAGYIFDTYCREKYTKKELSGKYGRVYFPKKDTPDLLRVSIADNFRGLTDHRLIKVFDSAQKYNTNWLDDLSKLVNENKHRNLTAQTPVEQLHINHATFGTNSLRGVTITGAKQAISINGSGTLDSIKKMDTFDGEYRREYYFESLNKSVNMVLNEVLAGSKHVIGEFNKVITP
ncbi:hypothetical protein [Gorillibacterium timonense]|uniref:hypothetical protein n=1 Tax=Gorillibacterium timonense TaxID=1689269 RepID=UPI00071C35CE|nr:hypothetical protein [Gorillibacterium timonense]